MKHYKFNMARVGSAALFAAAFIWGTSFVMMKDVSEKFPPSLLLALRFTIACAALALIFIKHMKKMDKSYLLPACHRHLAVFRVSHSNLWTDRYDAGEKRLSYGFLLCDYAVSLLGGGKKAAGPL